MKRIFYILLIILIVVYGYAFYHTSRIVDEAFLTEKKLLQETMTLKQAIIDVAIDRARSIPYDSEITTRAIEILRAERDCVEPSEPFYEALGDIEAVNAYYDMTPSPLNLTSYEERLALYLNARTQIETLRATIPGKWIIQFGGKL